MELDDYAKTLINHYRHEADRVTRLLCHVLKNIDEVNIDKIDVSLPGLKGWWEGHKKFYQVNNADNENNKKDY